MISLKQSLITIFVFLLIDKNLINCYEEVPDQNYGSSEILSSVASVDTGVAPRSEHLSVAESSKPKLPKCNENCLKSSLIDELSPTCPEIYSQIFVNSGFVPNNKSVGEFRLVKNVNTLGQCTKQCCGINGCSVALLIDTYCYLVFCTRTQDSCIAQTIPNDSTFSFQSMKTVYVRIPQPAIREASTCEDGIDTLCNTNEVCKRTNRRSRNGHCECQEQFVRIANGHCIEIPGISLPDDVKPTKDTGNENSSESSSHSSAILTPTQPPALKALQVSVGSKNITLPEDEATLFAYAVPEASKDNPYSYSWALISHPTPAASDTDPAQLEGQTTDSLKLTKLIQGTYVFQVTVKNSKGNAVGSANATVNVFPEKRINLPPVAIISPTEQMVQLPTSSAVLDGSSSTDDEKIVSYKWELQKGPIEYVFDQSKQSINLSTLQVKDLIPGSYVFKLTVEDSGHLTNFTLGNVTVMKQIDYPPTANAGNDVVIFLPQTEVVLNGNASSDDRKIVQWEWKATGDANKAVDIQDTHTPYLKLSHLEEGIYQFELRVTDEAGQQSNPSSVHVFVKPPTGNPPIANAGKLQTIALPQTWVVLDSSESRGDSKIVKWKWRQLSGPTNATIETPEGSRTNVTGLTKGEYEFELEIEDEIKLSAKAQVKVAVAQKLNEPPKANAGEDKVVALPVSLVELNGSGSKDDVKVTEWKWTREPDSSVAGTILGESNFHPVLQLSDLIPGKYVFRLTVKDEQGLSDSDTVVLTMKDDPMVENLIEIILAVPLTSWTETDKEKFLQQITLLLHDTKLSLHRVMPQLHSGFVVITFYGTREAGEMIPGLTLVSELRNRLRQDSNILEFPTISVDTVLCLDKCSGHGKCQDSTGTRECICDAFWMQNYFKKQYGTGERNCEWSKIYVVVISSLLLIMIYTIFWSLCFLFRRSRKVGGVLKDTVVGTGSSISNRLNHFSTRNGGVNKRHNHSQKKQYTLLGDTEEIDLEVTAIPLDSDEEQESDSDVSLVEVKRTSKGNSVVVKNSGTLSNDTKLSRFSSNNNNGLKRNGILKQPRQQNVKA